VLDTIEEERLSERAEAIGETLRARMESWQERFDFVGDVRGLGAMLAIEIVKDRGTKEPDADLAGAIAEGAFERGLLLLRAGIHSNCIRVLVPLVITDEQLSEALAAWEEALEHARGT
jgi:4-aminobutyrate aminotransferase/(S)-3-amino-2-methylpropionate transaminase